MFIVLDFETTGLSPAQGARTTEVAAVRIVDGEITDHYQSLMNAGVRIPWDIEDLTGISNAMIRKAPPISQVISELAEFIGDTPLVAHNASFDSKFLDAELAHIGLRRKQAMLCSLLLARRLFPDAPNHKLGTLVSHIGLQFKGRAHRALADAEMTALLWLHMHDHLQNHYALEEIPLSLLTKLQKLPKAKVTEFLQRCSSS
jgi:DNA polymerase-3 subunit epsilon